MSLLAVVDSPLQLINARECRHLLSGADRGGRLLCISRHEGNSAILRRMAADGDWDAVALIHHRGSALPHKRCTLRAAGRLLGGWRPEQAIIGEIRSDIQLHIAQVQHPRRLWIVDDGTANVYRSQGWLSHPQIGDAGRIAERAFKSLMLGMDCVRARHAVYFTTFPDNKPPGSKRIANRYALHRRLVAGRTAGPQSWVIGSNICERRGLPRETYLAYVRMLAERYGALRYRPHRYEDDDKLALIAALPEVVIDRSDSCLEHAVCNEALLPRRIVGPPSSAFISLADILGDSIELRCHRLDPALFPAGEQDFIHTVQEHIAKRVASDVAWRPS